MVDCDGIFQSIHYGNHWINRGVWLLFLNFIQILVIPQSLLHLSNILLNFDTIFKLMLYIWSKLCSDGFVYKARDVLKWISILMLIFIVAYVLFLQHLKLIFNKLFNFLSVIRDHLISSFLCIVCNLNVYVVLVQWFDFLRLEFNRRAILWLMNLNFGLLFKFECFVVKILCFRIYVGLLHLLTNIFYTAKIAICKFFTWIFSDWVASGGLIRDWCLLRCWI